MMTFISDSVASLKKAGWTEEERYEYVFDMVNLANYKLYKELEGERALCGDQGKKEDKNVSRT